MEHKQGSGRMHAIVKKVYVRRLLRQKAAHRVRVPETANQMNQSQGRIYTVA